MSVYRPDWREELSLPEMGPGGFGENFTVSGQDEATVFIGDVYEVGEAVVQVSQPRGPCANISRRWERPDLVRRVEESGRHGWYLRVLQEGVVEDPKFYGRIYCADREDDPGDPKTWAKANPSLIDNGGFVELEKIREKYVSLAAEGDLTSFKRYYLNMWDQKEHRLIDMGKWDASAGPWRAAGLLPRRRGDKARPLPSDLMDHFKRRDCWAGVDLSMTTDLSAVSFVFPLDEDGYDVLLFCWISEEGI